VPASLFSHFHADVPAAMGFGGQEEHAKTRVDVLGRAEALGAPTVDRLVVG
jgi:hypothetical protein